MEALVVTDTTKRLREPVAYLLLAFVSLYALASIFGLFVGDEFSDAAARVQGNLAAPGLTGIVLLAALIGAVWLVTGFGERTPNARNVTMVALLLLGVLGLIVLITAIAGFSRFGDTLPKVVGFIYDLGGLALYAAVGFILLKTFQALPAPVKAMPPAAHGQQFQPGQYDPSQYGAQPYGGQPYGGQAYGQPYAQHGPGQAPGAAPAPGWGQDPAQQQWGAGDPGQQWGAQQAWGQPDSGQHWGQPDQSQQHWGAPAEQGWQQDPNAQTQAWGADPNQQWGAQQQSWGGQEAGQWDQVDEQAHQAPQDQQTQQSWPAQPETWDAPDDRDQDQPPQRSSDAGADETAYDTQGADRSEQHDEVQSDQADNQQGWWSQPPR